jgi:hypothetical protein
MRKAARVTYKDHSGAARAAVDAAIADAIGEIAEALHVAGVNQAQAQIYDQPPAPSGYKRTRNLIGSIRHDMDETHAVVEAVTPYAFYVHEGTRFEPGPRPFLWDALQEIAPGIPKRLRKAFQRAGLKKGPKP